MGRINLTDSSSGGTNSQDALPETVQRKVMGVMGSWRKLTPIMLAKNVVVVMTCRAAAAKRVTKILHSTDQGGK